MSRAVMRPPGQGTVTSRFSTEAALFLLALTSSCASSPGCHPSACHSAPGVSGEPRAPKVDSSGDRLTPAVNASHSTTSGDSRHPPSFSSMLVPFRHAHSYLSRLSKRAGTASMASVDTEDVVSPDRGNASLCAYSSREQRPGESEVMNTNKVVVVSLLTIFSVTGCVGNAIAFYIYNKRRDKNASVIFILALAGTDFITCLVIIPSVIAFEVLEGRLTISAGCGFFLFLKTSNIPFSAYVMVAIALDRYLCICHPLVRILNVRRAKIIVGCLALVAFTFGLLTGLNFGIPSDTGALGNQSLSAWRPVSRANCTLCRRVANCSEQSRGEEEVEDTTDAETSLQCCVGSSPATNSTPPGDDVDSLSCQTNGFFPDHVLFIYAKVYASSFLVCFCLVVILYAMTYRSILSHRAKRSRRRKSSMRSRKQRASHSLTVDPGLSANGSMSRRQSEEHHANLYANIKTAAMLSVVAVVFIVAYLPAWMMTESINLIPYNGILYNMYFVYNVANPIIYAFMNKCFRRDLKKMMQVCRRRQ